VPHLSRARWAIAAVALTTAFTAGCQPPQPFHATGEQSAVTPEDSVLAMVNSERARAGIPALTLSTGAAGAAEDWSARMASTNQLAHNPDLAGSLAAHGVTGWRTAGENVGYGSSVEEVHQRFMASPAHRANILNRAFGQAGVGVVEANGRTWVTVVLVG
jgi:uncharacterized protein YkwD